MCFFCLFVYFFFLKRKNEKKSHFSERMKNSASGLSKDDCFDLCSRTTSLLEISIIYDLISSLYYLIIFGYLDIWIFDSFIILLNFRITR